MSRKAISSAAAGAVASPMMGTSLRAPAGAPPSADPGVGSKTSPGSAALSPHAKRLTAAQKRRIDELHVQGMRSRDIAQAVGCSQGGVDYRVNPEARLSVTNRVRRKRGLPEITMQELLDRQDARARRPGRGAVKSLAHVLMSARAAKKGELKQPPAIEHVLSLREVPGIYFRSCQWIEGEPDTPRCGRPTRGGIAWCSGHLARVYQPGSSYDEMERRRKAREPARRESTGSVRFKAA